MVELTISALFINRYLDLNETTGGGFVYYVTAESTTAGSGSGEEEEEDAAAIHAVLPQLEVRPHTPHTHMRFNHLF
jgi:hypothetical protein